MSFERAVLLAALEDVDRLRARLEALLAQSDPSEADKAEPYILHKRLTPAGRRRIQELDAAGVSFAQIARELSITKGAVRYNIDKFKRAPK